MGLDNVVDKYTVCVIKNDVIVGHFPRGKNGRLTKKTFYLLRADKYAKCKVIITGKEVHFGDDTGMQVPRLLKISRTRNMLQMLYQNIQN